MKYYEKCLNFIFTVLVKTLHHADSISTWIWSSNLYVFIEARSSIRWLLSPEVPSCSNFFPSTAIQCSASIVDV